MKSVLIVAVLLVSVISCARPKWHELEGYTFEKYVSDFGRRYAKGSDEYAMREAIFNEKIAKMRAHNADTTQSWKKGVNMFTDMTATEWKQYNRFKRSPTRSQPTQVVGTPSNEVLLPKEVDYRTWTSPRVLTAVKHQGSCGNCWSQSGVESLEAYYALLTNMLPVFSTQQMTSCTTVCYGCGGGDYVPGWEMVNASEHGLTEEWAYPFTNFFFNYSDPNATTAACKNISKEYPARPYTWFAELNEVGVVGYGRVTMNSAKAAMHALATIGPQSISVAAGNWQDYETGVMTNTDAHGADNEWQIDHAVQMVGYGHDKELGKDYWIVRNSWSTLWGEQGYVRLDRPKDEPCSPDSFGPVCGVSGCLSDLAWPVVAKNDPVHF